MHNFARCRGAGALGLKSLPHHPPSPAHTSPYVPGVEHGEIQNILLNGTYYCCTLRQPEDSRRTPGRALRPERALKYPIPVGNVRFSSSGHDQADISLTGGSLTMPSSSALTHETCNFRDVRVVSLLCQTFLPFSALLAYYALFCRSFVLCQTIFSPTDLHRGRLGVYCQVRQSGQIRVHYSSLFVMKK